MREFLEKGSFKVMDVSGNGLTDASVQDIVKNQKLSYLTINNNNLTDNGFYKILEDTHIEYLSIENNLLTDASIDYISKNIDILKIKYLRLK
jgi:Leucine-rich repeat (LRR) protein